MLTTPRKHFDVSFPRSHCNVKQLLLISSCAVVERTVTRCDGKLKAPVVKQKSLELELKGGRIFWAERKKGRNGLSFLPLGWKVEQRIRISPSAYRSFQTALSSLDFVYRNTSSPTPTPQKSWNRPNEQHEQFISSLHNFILRYLNFIQMPLRVLKFSMDESVTQHRAL